MQRLQHLVQHVVTPGLKETLLAAPTASLSETAKSDEDVVICSALRTPIGKANKGNLKDTAPEELLATLFRATVSKTKVDPKSIGDVKIGNVSQPGAGAATSRMAMFLADLPYEVPVSTVNRQCSSGLQAVAEIAASIRSGIIDVGLAGGVESMSMFNMMAGMDPTKFSPNIGDNAMAASCLVPMGITSENVAEKWNISRETQDKLAVQSHEKALLAQKQGLFNDEIVPVKTTVKDKEGNEKEVVVSADEGPKASTMEGLGKLRAAFKPDGSTTAGNSSQISDGAAMVLLARRDAAKKLGLPVIGRIRSHAVVGVDPNLMGIGPAFAIPEALKKANLSVNDIDIYEINEAFASQAAMSVQHLKIPMEKVNPKGGAIALGHPLGCTGSRQIATLMPELKRTGKKLGVVSMCIGTGMGAASVIESEQ